MLLIILISFEEGYSSLSKTIEELMQECGCCEICNGCIDCDCAKNLKNGPKWLSIDMICMDYDLSLAGGA